MILPCQARNSAGAPLSLDGPVNKGDHEVRHNIKITKTEVCVGAILTYRPLSHQAKRGDLAQNRQIQGNEWFFLTTAQPCGELGPLINSVQPILTTTLLVHNLTPPVPGLLNCICLPRYYYVSYYYIWVELRTSSLLLQNGRRPELLADAESSRRQEMNGVSLHPVSHLYIEYLSAEPDPWRGVNVGSKWGYWIRNRYTLFPVIHIQQYSV